MKALKIAPALILGTLLLTAGFCLAKADIVELYTEAVMTADIPELEKVLAPNFLYVGSNGHIRDKEHFIQELRDKALVVDRLSLSNQRDSSIGDTRLVTANGVFYGKSDDPRPYGLMRFSMIIANNRGTDQVALFQMTPVVGTRECKDGNCKIK